MRPILSDEFKRQLRRDFGQAARMPLFLLALWPVGVLAGILTLAGVTLRLWVWIVVIGASYAAMLLIRRRQRPRGSLES